jgi:flagellar basal-body rod protein FlgC
MADLIKSLSYAASGMEAQSARLRHVAENISNVDTPGYRRKLVSFDENMADGTVQAGRVVLDRTPLDQVYDPGNPLADATGHYDGSNVDLVVEVADAREAQRSYEANLKIFDQARSMTQSLFELLRR